MLQMLEYHDVSEFSDRQKVLSDNLKYKLRMNELTFRQYMPNILQQLKQIPENRFRAIVTKFDAVNLLDTQNTSVLYGRDPVAESKRHVEQFIHSAPTLTFSGQTIERISVIPEHAQISLKGQLPQLKLPLTKVPEQADTVIMLGLGLGHAVLALLNDLRPQNLIIYEPHLDMLLASLQTLDWMSVFELAEQKQVRLFLQSGSDGSSMAADIKELRKSAGAQTFHIYRHYPCLALDKAFARAFGLKGPATEHSVPMRACLSALPAEPQLASVRQEVFKEAFERNFQALQAYNETVAKQVQKAKSVKWLGYINLHGELNLLDTQTGWPLYFDSSDQSLTEQGDEQAAFETSAPIVVEIAASMKQGKLGQWHFNKVIKRAAHRRQLVVDSDPSRSEFTPCYVPGHVFIGVGLGYGCTQFIPQASEQGRLLIVQEANAELFTYTLATEFATDLLVSPLLEKQGAVFWIEPSTKQLASKTLDLFRSPRGYVLGATQWHAALRRSQDVQFAKALQDAVQSIHLLLTNFDDFRFTLNHTAANIEQGARFLVKNKHKLTGTTVIVGNGPSLNDEQLAWLRNNRDSLRIVSCGTALFTLYQANIQPDFHAEGEINRATYDWISSVNDREFLSQITVLGSSGLHPDSAALFKRQLLAFKADEQATEFMRSLPGWRSDIVEMNYASPTVSNSALRILLGMGAQHVILMGVDFALSEDSKHHADKSIYALKQLTDRQAGFETEKLQQRSITLEGNFRAQVSTKYEFKLATQFMGSVLKNYPRVTVENVSDGAKIHGAKPSRLENIKIKPLGKDNLDSLFIALPAELKDSLRELDWSPIVDFLKPYQDDSWLFDSPSREQIFLHTEQVLESVLPGQGQGAGSQLYPQAIRDLVVLSAAYQALLSCYTEHSAAHPDPEAAPEIQPLARGARIFSLLARELAEDLAQSAHRNDSTTLKFLQA